MMAQRTIQSGQYTSIDVNNKAIGAVNNNEYVDYMKNETAGGVKRTGGTFENRNNSFQGGASRWVDPGYRTISQFCSPAPQRRAANLIDGGSTSIEMINNRNGHRLENKRSESVQRNHGAGPLLDRSGVFAAFGNTYNQ